MKIVSGGQTGTDRAALDAAMENAIETGGWCPEGRLAEDGPIDSRYPLIVLPNAGYKQRTLQNVIDSDGTLIIYFDMPTGGTKLTIVYCENERKPKLLIDAAVSSTEHAVAQVIDFLTQNKIQVLNVAGPRASGEPRTYSYTKQLITAMLARLRI